MFCNQCEQTAHGTGCNVSPGTLLALDVHGIAIGPKPPAFVSPNVFKILQEKYDLRLTGDNPAADLAAAIG